MYFSTFLTEIRQAEGCRGLILLFPAQRNNNEYDYCNDIGQHPEQLL